MTTTTIDFSSQWGDVSWAALRGSIQPEWFCVMFGDGDQAKRVSDWEYVCPNQYPNGFKEMAARERRLTMRIVK